MSEVKRYHQNPLLLSDSDLEWYIRNLNIVREAAIIEEDSDRLQYYARQLYDAENELEKRQSAIRKDAR